jgi:hypothetical protein
MSYIYLIKDSLSSDYKIGKANNPIKRLSQLQTGSPNKLEIIHIYRSDLATKIEKALHNTYSSYRKEGEWFEIDLSIEQKFLNECEKIENNFNYLLENSTLKLS